MQYGDYPPGVTDDDINRWDNGDLNDDEWDDIEADLKEDNELDFWRGETW